MAAPKRITVNGVTYVREDAPAASAEASSTVKVEVASVCTCGHEFRFGRPVAAIAADPLGLCGLKGLKAHKR
jgi:hypothetical protein